ncbi:MAG: hypothetical protein Q4E88_03665 [Coriobacteriia bacterium]|nr:hypothetical protein [Coriobacteriia bacterium]
MSKVVIRNIICAFIVVSTIIIFVWGLLIAPFGVAPAGVLQKDDLYGINFFRFYTNLSNLFLGIASAIMLFYKRCPKWLEILYLFAATTVALTLVIVVIFLSPLQVLAGKSYLSMFERDMLFFHLINPILGFVVFGFLTNNFKLTLKHKILALIPTLVYGFVYLLNVVFLRIWKDFYSFTFGGNNAVIPIVFIVILTVVFGLASLLAYIHNRRVNGKHN